MRSEIIYLKVCMIYKLKYHPNVKKSDLPKIDAKNRNRIKRAIEERLTKNPEIYGKPLQRTLKGCWKLRVGDYRNEDRKDSARKKDGYHLCRTALEGAVRARPGNGFYP